jgi:trehalose 6-phosphate phosphatase
MGGNGGVTTEPILAKRHAQTLSTFALGNLLLAFDYDGTLAPIAPTPEGARMRATTRTLLRRVARCYPSVVISGRALEDISRRMHGIPLWYVFGNHGSEPLVSAGVDHKTADWIRILRRVLPADPGVVIEDKTHTVTVHYRAARDPEAAREAALRAALQIPEARVVGGKQAVNLLHRGGPDKSSALRYAVKAFACDIAIYVGDDDTDEDAFGALDAHRLLAVRVGRPTGPSRAAFHLERQSEIDLFLERLLDLRGGEAAVRALRRAPGR